MKKFEGILICTDLDGTLLQKNKNISKENLDAIEYFKSEGGYFTFVTGRMPFFSSDICERIKPNCPFGCGNGTGLYDHITKKYIYTTPLDPSALDLVEYIESTLPEMGIQINTFEHVYFSRNNLAMELYRGITGLPNLKKNYRDIEEPIAKIVFGDTREGSIEELEKLLRAHPKANTVDLIRSEKILFDIIPKGIGKGNSVKELAKYLGIDISKTVAVGDYPNDISMIRAAGVGIAVANAHPDVKKAADLVTVSNEEHAIARIISDIENGSIRI